MQKVAEKIKKIRIEEDLQNEGTELPHMWSKCIGAGRAAEGLRAGWQKQLRQAKKECGFEYIRFHGLLAEDMFVCERRDEKIYFNWQYIDELFDFLMEIQVRPVVEFGFMPPALASGNTTQFWWKGNVTPPSDYSEWSRLIHELILHWKERYGLAEIRQWYYEVWNEPNLHAFWDATRSEYFRLYEETVKAVKGVDFDLRVGGPATSNFVPDDRFDFEVEDVSRQMTHRVENLDCLNWRGVWIEAFLTYCSERKLPVDFVSAHPYPTDFALEGQQTMKGRSRSAGSLQDDMEWMRKTVTASAYPNAEILLTEWSSSPTSRDYSHDYLPAADYIIQSNLDTAGMANCLSYWVFTDIFEEVGGGPQALHGGFGLMNVKGFRKPAYYAYQFLNHLGNRQLKRGEQYIVTKKENGKLSALIWNYAEELKTAIPISEYPDYKTAEAIQQMGSLVEVQIHIGGLKPRSKVCVWIIEKENTLAEYWAKVGYPQNFTKKQEEELAHQVPKKNIWQVGEDGVLDETVTIGPWGIVMIEEVE